MEINNGKAVRNRRVRNRTHGGVGGRRVRTRLLPDYLMKIIIMTRIIFFVQIALIGTFFYCSWQADQAMDKAGIGNFALWRQYSSYAGFAFYLAVCLWVITIITVVSSKRFTEKSSQIAIGFPPIIMVSGWLLYWFI